METKENWVERTITEGNIFAAIGMSAIIVTFLFGGLIIIDKMISQKHQDVAAMTAILPNGQPGIVLKYPIRVNNEVKYFTWIDSDGKLTGVNTYNWQTLDGKSGRTKVDMTVQPSAPGW